MATPRVMTRDGLYPLPLNYKLDADDLREHIRQAITWYEVVEAADLGGDNWRWRIWHRRLAMLIKHYERINTTGIPYDQ